MRIIRKMFLMLVSTVLMAFNTTPINAQDDFDQLLMDEARLQLIQGPFIVKFSWPFSINNLKAGERLAVRFTDEIGYHHWNAHPTLW